MLTWMSKFRLHSKGTSSCLVMVPISFCSMRYLLSSAAGSIFFKNLFGNAKAYAPGLLTPSLSTISGYLSKSQSVQKRRTIAKVEEVPLLLAWHLVLL